MVAGTDARVLITGESGTGKELLARAIHEASPRRNKPFVAHQLQRHGGESARVRAVRPREGRLPRRNAPAAGLFRAADGGTLLLDEIGDMPMRLQVKLLRVLQENSDPPGGQHRAGRRSTCA